MNHEPLPLSDFPGIPAEYIELLRSLKIVDTRDFLTACKGPGMASLLPAGTLIPEARLQELRILSELSRFGGVNGLHARELYEAGIRSVDELKDLKQGDP